jgi:hypothetical protein
LQNPIDAIENLPPRLLNNARYNKYYKYKKLLIAKKSANALKKISALPWH